MLVLIVAAAAGVRPSAAADADVDCDALGMLLLDNCTDTVMALLGDDSGVACDPVCAAAVEAVVKPGCWDAVKEAAASVDAEMANAFDALKTKCQGGSTSQPSPSPAAPASPSPSVPPNNSSASPWTNYTRQDNTLFIAMEVLSSTTAESDGACAKVCNADSMCRFYTWCPTDVAGGCGIPAANATNSSTVAAGGCITSGDSTEGRTFVFIAYGKSVPFVGGEYHPVGATDRRRLLEAAPVWTNYSQQEHRFYQAVDALPVVGFRTSEECAQACNADEKCMFWTQCPLGRGAEGCQLPSFTPNAPPQKVEAAACLLSYNSAKDQTAYFTMYGDAVPFEGGRWKGSDGAKGPSTTTSGTPNISLPTVPGLAGSNATNTTLPPAATETLDVQSAWYYGEDEANCFVWNGTELVDDESTTFAAGPSSATVEAAERKAYVDKLCASLDTAGQTMAADLLAGGAAAHKAFLASGDFSNCPGAEKDALFYALVDFVQDNQDVATTSKYAQAWAKAGSELGWAVCVTIAAVDTSTGKAVVQSIKS